MILIGGGSRSGKSSAALRMLRAAGSRRGLIATAQALDDEMEERIAHHRMERDAAITVWEEPVEIARIIAENGSKYDAIAVDCLTLWLSNLMVAGQCDFRESYELLVDAAISSTAKVIFVTNEVGCGIVPDTSLGRQFRDEQGRLNQFMAARASEVHWMVFGIGLRVK